PKDMAATAVAESWMDSRRDILCMACLSADRYFQTNINSTVYSSILLIPPPADRGRGPLHQEGPQSQDRLTLVTISPRVPTQSRNRRSGGGPLRAAAASDSAVPMGYDMVRVKELRGLAWRESFRRLPSSGSARC